MERSPRWSVVVPTRRRPGRLRACIEALAAVREPEGGVELIVVDDDPEGSGGALVRSLGDAVGIRALYSGGRGPAAARNLGAGAARGEMLAFTDDDCEPQAGWLQALARALPDGTGCAIAGVTHNAEPSPCSEASQLIVDALHAAQTKAGAPNFAASNNVAFPAAGFEAIGGFDESFPDAAAEDRDICERWIGAGNRLMAAPEAVVLHRHRLTVEGFWRQHYRYGRGARAFHLAQRRRGAGRMRLQPGFYVSLARELRAGRHGRGRPALGALALLSQLANASGYVAAFMRQG